MRKTKDLTGVSRGRSASLTGNGRQEAVAWCSLWVTPWHADGRRWQVWCFMWSIESGVKVSLKQQYGGKNRQLDLHHKVQNLTYFLPNNLSESFHIYNLQLCAQSQLLEVTKFGRLVYLMVSVTLDAGHGLQKYPTIRNVQFLLQINLAEMECGSQHFLAVCGSACLRIFVSFSYFGYLRF